MIHLVLFFHLIQFVFSLLFDDTITSTSYGQVKGLMHKTVNKGNVISYIGIPYALPPIHANRFREPQPLRKWDHLYLAQNKKVSCIQFDKRFEFAFDNQNQSEDCLYLNIHVWYQPLKESRQQKFPVVVYFHGGDFSWGSKDMLSLRTFVTSLRGLVFVTVNYRLGPLGFLSSNNDDIYGNYGLRDMIFALRWIKNEIPNFNGDPNKITIFGHDAGAISVSMLMLSTYKEKLFRNAIASSGNVFTPWAWSNNPFSSLYQLAKSLNCPAHGDYSTLKCLRRVSVEDLFNQTVSLGLKFRPVLDKNLANRLFEDDPLNQYESGKFVRVPLLVGTVAMEGALDFYYLEKKLDQFINTEDKIKYLVNFYLEDKKMVDAISYAIYYHYFLSEEAEDYNESRKATARIIQMIGDFIYLSPALLTLYYHAKHQSPAKFYNYKYRYPPNSFIRFQTKPPLNLDSLADRQATHFDDILTMFQIHLSNEYISEGDSNLENMFQHFRSCIFHFIEPELPSLCVSPWPLYRTNDPKYLEFGAGGVVKSNYVWIHEKFWNYLVLKLRLLNTTVDTFPYSSYRTYQRATWTLTSFTVLLLIVALILLVMVFKARKDKMKTVTFIRRREGFSER